VQPLELIAAAAVALAVIAGSVLFGLRVSASSARALRERVAATNAALRAAAARLGLALTEPTPYRHPVVGDVPSYAAAAGAYRGRPVRIDVESDEDAGRVVVTLAADAARPWPDLGRLAPSREARPHLAPALAALGPRASEVRVTPEALRVALETPADGACDGAELVAAVDAAVALAEALGATST
jgi:sugar phosphate isomerase/epimerase